MAKQPQILKFQTPVSRGTGPPAYDRKLLEPWEWTWVHDGKVDHIRIPASTEEHPVIYDPSIPYYAQSVVPDDPLEAASLPHDVIYKLQGRVKPIISRWFEEIRSWHPVHVVSRAYADDMFEAILKEQDVSSWRRRLAMWAVRSRVGKWAWDEEDDFTLP